MRIVAALLVFVHHHGLPLQPPLGGLASRIQKDGYVGVALFFVLSGFLITYRNYQSARLSFHWLKNYLLGRFARIYPLVFLLMVTELLVAHFDHHDLDAGAIALNFTLSKGYVNQWKFTLLPQAWTLSAEETFYLVAPFLLFSVRRGRVSLPLLLVPWVGICRADSGQRR